MKTAQDLITAAKAEVSCLTAEEAAARIREAGVVLIDLREPEEHEQASIPVAVNIPRGVLEFKIGDACEGPDGEIVMHCGGGGRASLAAQSLKNMGYNNVHIVNAKFEDFASAYNG